MHDYTGEYMHDYTDNQWLYWWVWARARILDTVANLATHFQKL